MGATIPSLFIGSIAGRLVGELLKQLVPEWNLAAPGNGERGTSELITLDFLSSLEKSCLSA